MEGDDNMDGDKEYKVGDEVLVKAEITGRSYGGYRLSVGIYDIIISKKDMVDKVEKTYELTILQLCKILVFHLMM